MRQLLFIIFLFPLFVFGQKNSKDTLINLGCSTKPAPDTLKYIYSGSVAYENKPVADLTLLFCKYNDTTIVKTNEFGSFTTTLLILNDRRAREYPKLLIENKKYKPYQFQITEFYLETIPIGYRQDIILEKWKK